MVKKPKIAISLDYCKETTYSKYAPWYALRENYCHAISRAGGIPFCLPHESEQISEYIQLADGFVIPGGDYDIDPTLYQAKQEPSTRLLNPKRTQFETELIKAILKNNKPLLAICAGMQLLNVILGGTLYQDIYHSQVIHEQPNPHLETAHSIQIDPLSKLCHFTGQQCAEVNSTHHQAIDVVGQGLTVSARAEDGTIEAIELEQHPFVIGVEWHPEYQLSTFDQHLWQQLIKQSSS